MAARIHLGAPFGVVAGWRRVVSLALFVAVLALILLGLVQFWQGLATGIKLIGYATILWSVAVALALPWSAPGPASLFRNWIGPALLGGVVMVVFGLLTDTDYQNFLFIALAALFSAAWAQAGLHARPTASG